MASGRNRDNANQGHLPFALADGSARDRRRQLAMAVADARLDSDAKLIALLIYDQTGEGIGRPWATTPATLHRHVLGPCCQRDKFYRTLRALTDAGIISVERTDRARGGAGTLPPQFIDRADLMDSRDRRHYAIDWEGVYALRSLPLPESLAGFVRQGLSVIKTVRNTESVIRTNPECLSVIRTNTMGGSVPYAAPDARTHAPARARLSSCLVFLSSVVDVDDKTFRQNLRARANATPPALFAHLPMAKLDAETRRFIACIAAIALAGEEWAEWIDYAVGAAARARPDRPGAYLRGTLRRALVEFSGLADTLEEADAAMGRLLTAARPVARPLFAARQTEAVP